MRWFLLSTSVVMADRGNRKLVPLLLAGKELKQDKRSGKLSWTLYKAGFGGGDSYCIHGPPMSWLLACVSAITYKSIFLHANFVSAVTLAARLWDGRVQEGDLSGLVPTASFVAE